MTDAQESTVNTISNNSYRLGIVTGLENASDILNDLAAAQFRNRRDEWARHTRDLADQLTAEAKKQRKAYDDLGRQETTEAWARLDGWFAQLTLGQDEATR